MDERWTVTFNIKDSIVRSCSQASNEIENFEWEQCDQSGKIIFQHLAIYINVNLPNGIHKTCQSSSKILPNSK